MMQCDKCKEHCTKPLVVMSVASFWIEAVRENWCWKCFRSWLNVSPTTVTENPEEPA